MTGTGYQHQGTLSPSERAAGRKAILQDVEKLLTAGKIRPTRGSYFEVHDETFTQLRRATNLNPGSSLRDFITEPFFKCEVCAIGAVFMAYVDKFNKVKVDTYYCSDTMLHAVSDYFTEFEMMTLEAAFEGFSHPHQDQLERFQEYADPADRLLEIVGEMLKHDTLLPQVTT